MYTAIRSCTAETLAERMILSRESPSSSARSADNSADCTIASRVTARASSGSGDFTFSSISRVSSSWSSEPQLAPMRTGLLCLMAVSTIAENCISFLLPKPNP